MTKYTSSLFFSESESKMIDFSSPILSSSNKNGKKQFRIDLPHNHSSHHNFQIAAVQSKYSRAKCHPFNTVHLFSTSANTIFKRIERSHYHAYTNMLLLLIFFFLCPRLVVVAPDHTLLLLYLKLSILLVLGSVVVCRRLH